MKKRWFMWALMLMIFCLGMLPGRKSFAAELPEKETGGLTLEAECGYDRFAKFGRNIPFKATVTSAESFEGILRVLVPADNGEGNYAYEYPVSVEAGTSLTVRGEVPLLSNYTVISFQIIAEKKKVLTEQVILKTSGREVTELYVGVISMNEQAVDAFQGVNVGEYTDSSFPYVKTRAFALTGGDIENVHYGMECLDIIVLDRYMAARLSEKQKEALFAWVSAGGSLIVEMTSGQYLFSDDTYPVSESVEARPYLWGQTQPVKAGNVGYFDLKVADMGLMEFAVDNNVIPGSLISRVCSAETITQIIENDHYYEGEYQYNTVAELLDTAMGRKLPRISLYVVIILVYLGVAGPGVFYVLKKKDKAFLTGKAVMCVAVLFSVIIYLLGASTRYQQPVIRYATILTLEGAKLSEESYIDAKAPNSDSYQLSLLPGYFVRPLSKDNHYYYEAVDASTVLRDYKSRLYHGEEETLITVRHTAPFESQYFKLEREWENKDFIGFGADLKYFSEEVSGSVYNETQQKLENVMLILRNNIYVVGDLNAGDVVDIQNAERLYFYPDSCEQTADSVTGWSEASYRMNAENQEYAVLSEKTKLLSYYLAQIDSMQETGAVLLAFATSDTGNFQTDGGYPVYGATLLNKKVVLDTTSGELDYRNLSSAEIINIDADSGYNDKTGSSYSSSIRLQYDLGSREKLNAVRFARAGVDEDNPDYKAFSGETFFYNPTTLVYEKVDLSKENIWLLELEKYLTEREGRCYLIVQYSSDFLDTEQYKEILLPVVSVIRKR